MNLTINKVNYTNNQNQLTTINENKAIVGMLAN